MLIYGIQYSASVLCLWERQVCAEEEKALFTMTLKEDIRTDSLPLTVLGLNFVPADTIQQARQEGHCMKAERPCSLSG